LGGRGGGEGGGMGEMMKVCIIKKFHPKFIFFLPTMVRGLVHLEEHDHNKIEYDNSKGFTKGLISSNGFDSRIQH
jgi:hypothetical protein